LPAEVHIGDFLHDDEPTEIRTAHGSLVTLPAHGGEQRDNLMIVQQSRSSLLDTKVLRHAPDRYYQEAQEGPRTGKS
jgi:hypothetical protein